MRHSSREMSRWYHFGAPGAPWLIAEPPLGTFVPLGRLTIERRHNWRGTMAATRWLVVVVAGTLTVGASEAGSGKPAEPDQAALVESNSEFTVDLYARLRARSGNVFFSSYSISNALAMTYAGARGPTATQMATALRFPMDGDRLHETFAKVNRDVKDAGSKGGSELHVANALWIQTGFATLPAFLATVKNDYGAGLTPVDFRSTPEKARTTINAWVQEQTRDRIVDLIAEGV